MLTNINQYIKKITEISLFFKKGIYIIWNKKSNLEYICSDIFISFSSAVKIYDMFLKDVSNEILPEIPFSLSSMNFHGFLGNII